MNSSRLVAATLVSALLLGGCSDDKSSKVAADEPTEELVTAPGSDRSVEMIDGSDVVVEGAFGELPIVKVPHQPPPVGTTKTVIDGAGDVLAENDRIVVHVGVYVLGDATVLGTSWVDEVPLMINLDAEQAPPALLKALVGARIGSRIWVTTTGTEARAAGSEASPYDTAAVLMVVDVVDAVHANATVDGAVEALPSGYPTVVGAAGQQPVVSAATIAPPAEMGRAPVVMGAGQQLGLGSTAIVHYVMADWETGEVVDSTWSRGGPMFLLIGGNILPQQVDQQLSGVTEGSRAMVVFPPVEGRMLAGGLDPTRSYVVVVDVLRVLANHTQSDPTELEVRDEAKSPREERSPASQPS